MKDKKNNPDASVDRLLASALTVRPEAPVGACLDADAFAAWADGALDPRERARAEAHAADCARCQQLLAAMVRTLPPPAMAKSPWRMPALAWLVPITAAATALVVWIAVPKPAPVQVSEVAATVDQVEPAPRSARSSEPDVPANDSKAKVQAETEPQRQVASERDVSGSPGPASPRESAAVAPLAKEASPPKSANTLSEAVTISPAAPASGSAPPPALAPAAPLQSADSTVRREVPLASGRVSAFATAPESVIVSSNPATRFRLLRGGGVQRSADAGATWRTEVTGATETLTAGVSPSPSVCWLIGPGGSVVLSTSGSLWRRLAFPEAVDLRAISATDGENATVTTADGRVFVTADGGRTWSRMPGI